MQKTVFRLYIFFYIYIIILADFEEYPEDLAAPAGIVDFADTADSAAGVVDPVGTASAVEGSAAAEVSVAEDTEGSGDIAEVSAESIGGSVDTAEVSAAESIGDPGDMTDFEGTEHSGNHNRYYKRSGWKTLF